MRCLVFSRNEETVQPVLEVLTELEIEGEFCADAAVAAEKIAARSFQIVVADWDAQPEAASLLKTAREQKAAQRPLTLAIVEGDALRGEALRAGANSVLSKPLRVPQVRDTIKAGYELLQAKMGAPAPRKARAVAAGIAGGTASVKPPLSPSAATPPSFTPTGFTPMIKSVPVRGLAQFPPAAPVAQFETKTLAFEETPALAPDPLPDLEPMAGAVEDGGSDNDKEDREALTGWAALQTRLSAGKPQAAVDGATKFQASAGPDSRIQAKAQPREWEREPEFESRPFASEGHHATQREAERGVPAKKGPGVLALIGLVAVTVGVLAAVPQTRQGMQSLYWKAVVAAANWMNPKTAPLPQAASQHDSFGQSGDEYKLPAGDPIPDGTTDPSKIEIVPVVDPTAKDGKGAEAGSQNSGSQNSGDASQGAGAAVPAQEPTTAANPTQAETGGGTVPVPVQAKPSPLHAAPSAAKNTAPSGNPMASNAGIPSSLRSQLASTTPDSSGTRPEDSAMSAIEPVVLPETATWTLLEQKVDPEYPASAKAGGQHGIVTVQVLIARDGAVQEVKFVQGSLAFARAAIDAVKQWHFKPYVMNGRAVSVQSTITLKFTPPA